MNGAVAAFDVLEARLNAAAWIAYPTSSSALFDVASRDGDVAVAVP